MREGEGMSETSDLVPIGALSRMSGVPTETIRTWERRYGLLSPERDHRDRRLYGEEDVERLRLVSQLVEAGERVADLARMTNRQLRDRVQVHEGGPGVALPASIRAAVLHDTLAEVLDGVVPTVGRRIEVVAHAVEPAKLAVQEPVDVVYIDVASVGSDVVAGVDEVLAAVPATAAVVLYHYLPRPVRAELAQRPIRLVQAPLPVGQIRQHGIDALLASGASAGAPAVGPVQYSRSQLERLMNRAPSLQCECPNHLAELLLKLREFEVYSAQCASRSPEDAALHRDLAHGAGAARTQLETLLARVCAYDGIEV